MITVRRRGVAAVVAAVVVSGCNATMFDTFDVDRGTSRVLAPDQRVLITKTVAIKGKHGETETVRMVCAEPSPDAISARGASIAGAGTAIGSANVAASISAEAAAAIGLRTASVNLIRDLGYRICEATMNGVLGRGEYERILAGTPAVAVGVFAIDGLTQMRTAPVMVSAGEGTQAASTIAPVSPQDPQYITAVATKVVEVVRVAMGDIGGLHEERRKSNRGTQVALIRNAPAANRTGAARPDKLVAAQPPPSRVRSARTE